MSGAEYQYKGTQGDQLITTPQPPRRFPSRSEVGETILGKPDEERPLKTACVKLAVALTAAPIRLDPSSLLKLRNQAANSRATLGVRRVGGLHVDNTGAALTRRAANPHKFVRPMAGTTDHAVMQQRLLGMSPSQRQHIQGQISGKPVGWGRRLATRALTAAASPMGAIGLSLGVPLAMQMLPGGRDEYGNRRSFAETGVGQTLGMAAGLAPMALPSVANGVAQRSTQQLMTGRPAIKVAQAICEAWRST